MIDLDLHAAEEELFPLTGKGAFAAALGVNASTLWRNAKREQPQGPVACAIKAWLILKRDFDILPPATPGSIRDIEEMAEMVSPGVRQRSGLLGFEAAAFVVFGDGWKGKLAAALGMDYSAIWRQIDSGNIKGPVLAAMRAWLVLSRIGGEPPAQAERTPRRVPRRRPIPTYARLLLDD